MTDTSRPSAGRSTRGSTDTYELKPTVQKYHSIHASGGKLEDLPEYVQSQDEGRLPPVFPYCPFPVFVFSSPDVAGTNKTSTPGMDPNRHRLHQRQTRHRHRRMPRLMTAKALALNLSSRRHLS